MTKISLILATIVLLLGCCVSNARAQKNVTLKGKTFIVQKDSSENQGTPTGYEYRASDGTVYPVYLSKNGKAFIWRISKKKGKKYRQSLPKITEMLNKANKPQVDSGLSESNS